MTIGGVTGTELVVEAKEGSGYQTDICGDAECVALFYAQQDTRFGKLAYAVEPGSKLRIDVLDVEGTPLLILTEILGGDFDALVPVADAVLATVKFGP